MQRLRTVTLAPAAAVANNIATSQKPAAGGVQALTLNGALVSGGVATLDIARRVAIASSADDSARTFVVTGTNRYGDVQTETIKGPATTVNTLKDFKTVTSITVDANTAGNLTVGTSGVASSPWIPVDRNGIRDIGIGCRVSGTANYTIEHTFEDPFRPPTSGINQVTDFYLTPYPHPTLAAQSSNQFGNYADTVPSAVRLTLNSFTAPGSVSADFAPGFAGQFAGN